MREMDKLDDATTSSYEARKPISARTQSHLPLPLPYSTEARPQRQANEVGLRLDDRVARTLGRIADTKPIRTIHRWLHPHPHSDGSSTPPERPTRFAYIRLGTSRLLSRFERLGDTLSRPIARSYTLLVIFCALWIVAMSLLVNEAWYSSSSSLGIDPTPISCLTSYWGRNADCGLDGQACAPFDNTTLVFRCPAGCENVQLLNNRTVGEVDVVHRPLVIGGGDEQGTYHGESWICAAAIHRGLGISNDRGGCGVLRQTGTNVNYLSSRSLTKSWDFTSLSFPSVFPSSYIFDPSVHFSSCRDIRHEILIFNVLMTFILSFLLRPRPLALFWILVCVGFWHITLASEPRSYPPDISGAFATFLPTLFVCYAFWRFAWRWTLPDFEDRIAERTVWLLGPWWVGVLLDSTLGWIPIDRLTGSDIGKRAGGVAALIIIILIVAALVIYQAVQLRKAGKLIYYLQWYLLGGAVIGILAAIPGLNLRFHHYILGIILTPGSAIPGREKGATRASLIFQSFLLGMFLNGVARWGFDSLLQTDGELRGDATSGSFIPTFDMPVAGANGSGTLDIRWEPIPANLTDTYNGFALLVNDVLRYQGGANTTTWTAQGLREDVPYYFRIAYQLSSQVADFTRAAVWQDGTWREPAPGRT